MKNINFVLLTMFINCMLLGFISCSEYDEILLNIDETDKLVNDTAMKTCDVIFNIDLEEFDQTRASDDNWKNGDRIYLTFGNGAYGAIEYKNDKWTLEYYGNPKFDSLSNCIAVYFEDIKSTVNFSTIYSESTGAVYVDTVAQYYFSEKELNITAKLIPQTGRLRFKGNPGDIIYIYGLPIMGEYSVYKSEFKKTMPLTELIVGDEGYTPYVYGTFTSDLSQRINVVTKCNAFNRTFPDSVMASGVSGYLDIPTDSSYRNLNWKKNLVCRIGDIEFAMIPLIKNGEIAFFMGETEVTRDLYNAVYNQTTDSVNYPQRYDSFSTADSFVKDLNDKIDLTFRIPTKDEWQYAAKGGHKSAGCIYSGSNSISDVAWYSANSNMTVHEVAQLMPNELGFYDMSGNFSEWASTLINYEEWIDGWGVSRYAYPYCGGRYTSSEKECEVTEYNLAKTNSLYNVGLRLALSIN